MGSLPDSTYMWWGSDDYFVLEQDPRGYAKVLDHMVKDSVPPGDSRVIFGQFVSNIAYNTKGVTVTTKGGKTYTANEVITTIPLGALQRNHGALFSPALPSKHAAALEPNNGFVMANLTRVILQFPSVWWDNSLNRWLSANKGANTSEASGEFAEWQNFNHEKMLPGSQILLNFMGDPQSSKYEGMSNDDVQVAAMAALRAQHPQKTIPDPVAFFMSRWSRAGGAYGAYSGWAIGMKDKAFSQLIKPLKDSNKNERVYFAGEAMCDDLSGFTHGARQSGREVVAKYLYSVGKGPNPSKTDHLNLCWF
jgi:monoamine oxidase